MHRAQQVRFDPIFLIGPLRPETNTISIMTGEAAPPRAPSDAGRRTGVGDSQHAQRVDRCARVAVKKGCGHACPRTRQFEQHANGVPSPIPIEPAGGSPIAYFPLMPPIGLPNTSSGFCAPLSNACAMTPTKGIARLTVLLTGVLQQLANHRKRPLGVSRSPAIRCCPCTKVSEAGDLYNVRTAMNIEQVGTTELMRKRLAIVAVADHAIDCPRRCVGNPPADFPATAPQLRFCGHVCP
jgi:hypothetical protein